MAVDTRVAPTLQDPTTRALWIGAVLAFGVGDVVTTRAGFAIDPGPATSSEANPVARAILEQFGFAGLVAWKVVVLVLFFLLFRSIPREFRAGVPIGLIVLGLGITAFNINQIQQAGGLDLSSRGLAASARRPTEPSL